MSRGATYVYCLVQSARAPSVKGAPKGMPGAGAPRVLAVDRGIWAVVADAPLDRFSDEHLQEELQDVEAVSRHALAHASVIEFFFRHAPVIPLKLFTLFSQDDRARQDLAARGSKVRALFARLRGLEEWGVRITASTRSARPGQAAAPVKTGRDYLEVKKRLQAQDGAPSRSTKKDVGDALKALRALAADTLSEDFPPPGPGRPYVTGASYLVKARRGAAWKKRVAQLAKALDKQGHRIEVSGPWPPYHFTSTK